MRSVVVAALVWLVACDLTPSESNDSAGELTILEQSDVRLLGTSDVLAIVQDLEVLPDRGVWVLNSVEPLFVHFDVTGDIVDMYGRLGGGPTEFGSPAGFVVGGIDGSAWVVDVQRHLLREVSGTDRPAREVRLPREGLPVGSIFGTNPFRQLVKTVSLGEEVLIPRRAGDLDGPVTGVWISIWTADIVAVKVDLPAVREVLSLGSVLADPSDHYVVEGSGLPFPFWYRLWTVCSDNELRLYDRLRNEVRRFTPDGIEVGQRGLPDESLTEVSPREFARAMFDLAAAERMGRVPDGGIQLSSADSAQVLNDFVPGLTADGSQLASVLPEYVDLRCDSEGTQWIQPFDIDAPGAAFDGLRGGRLWIRTTADGQTDRVRMPERFDPYRFTPDRIWGVQRNAFDVATIAWISVP